MKVKETIKKLLKSTIQVVCITAIALSAPYAHKDYIRGIADESTVQIFGQEGSGSGSHVQLEDGRTVILTNKHICDMTGPLMVQTEHDKNPIARKIIKVSDRHDLCVIEGVPGYKGIKMGSRPEIGDELYTLGHPRGESLNIAKGEYFADKEIMLAAETDKDGNCREGKVYKEMTIFGEITVCVLVKDSYQLSSPTYPGNSGSPVVNKYGNLVGVIFAGSTQVENQGFAVPYVYVSEFLESI